MTLPAAGLKGRLALVTGAGRGIGAAVAGRLTEAGCAVAVNDLDETTARATAAALASGGANAEAFAADVSDPAAVEAMFGAAEEWGGRVEILVNNAAFLFMADLIELDLGAWHRTIDVNLGGTLWCSRRALPAMRASGWGRIVNVASIWGLIGSRGATAYCASKGGIVGLTTALARDLTDTGVRVAAVAPGVIDTQQLEADAAYANLPLDEMKTRYAVDTLVGRIGTPREIAEVVAFLASDEGVAFHGRTVPVTGGRSD